MKQKLNKNLILNRKASVMNGRCFSYAVNHTIRGMDSCAVYAFACYHAVFKHICVLPERKMKNGYCLKKPKLQIASEGVDYSGINVMRY